MGKFGVTPADVAAIRTRILRAAFIAQPDFILDAVAEDPDDNRVLECAIAGKADCIVSGDRHLLKLGSYEGIPIRTVRQFMNSIEAIESEA